MTVDAGYSGTPLQQKLGLRPGHRVAFVGCVPDGFDATFTGIAPRRRLGGHVDVVVLFVEWRRELERRAAAAAEAIAPAGAVWVAWPKKASKQPTDVTEDVLRDVLLPTGLVDTKVCAIDDTWSGLRFVWRRDRRPS